jgi:hypothetical protein
MEWLQRDPENGMLIGPDGCHYMNEHQAAHFGLLGLCGCGSPEDSFNFCRDVLVCFDRRGEEWVSAEDAISVLVSNRPEIAAHVLAHLLTNLNLIEHGSSVGGSWLTENGQRIVDLGPVTEDQMDQDPLST